MEGGWQEIELGQLVDAGHAEIRTGPFGTQLRASDYTTAGGVPVVNVRNLGYGGLRPADLEHVDRDVQQRLASHLLRPSDIVFGRKGAVDRHLFVTEAQDGWMQGSDCIRLRLTPSAPILPSFLSKALLTRTHSSWIAAQCSHGATMASLNQDIIRRIVVRAPNLGAQSRIAAVLAAFDKLIEINERRIALLDELARSLYREWFVRFRFPGHEDIEFVASELGPIPREWNIRSLGGMTENLDRFRRPLSRRARSERGGSFPYFGAAKLIDWIDGYLFEGEHLLFAEDGTVQTPEGWPVLQLVDERFWANNHTHILRGSGVSTRYLYAALARYPIAGHVTGAAQPKITQANLNRIPVIVPTREIAEHFDHAVDPMFDQIRVARQSLRVLATCRDVVLPRLVTGKRDISEIDLGALMPSEAV
jgi:type I restriction enzyme S subunit